MADEHEAFAIGLRETGGGPTYLPDDALSALPRALSRVGIPT